jgi:hypothetical protein
MEPAPELTLENAPPYDAALPPISDPDSIPAIGAEADFVGCPYAGAAEISRLFSDPRRGTNPLASRNNVADGGWGQFGAVA